MSTPLRAIAGLRIDGAANRDAVVAASDVVVDAAESTGAGPLHFMVDFGEGEPVAEAVARHVYQNPGTYTITVVVSDGAGRSDSVSWSLVASVLTGTWFHAGWNPKARKFERRLLVITDQEGARVRGFYGLTNTPDSVFTGTLAAERVLQGNVAGVEGLEGTIPDRVRGDTPWALRVLGGTRDGSQLLFRPTAGVPASPPPDAVFRLVGDSVGDPFVIAGRSHTHYDGTSSRGDGLSYLIEFGDGTVSDAAAAVHVLPSGTTSAVARLWVVDRFGRVDAEEMPIWFLHIPQCEGYGCGASKLLYSPWHASNPTNRYLWFMEAAGDTVRGFGSQGPFVGMLQGERDFQLHQVDGSDFVGHFEFDASAVRSIAGGYLTGVVIVLTQTSGLEAGLTWRLYEEFTYA